MRISVRLRLVLALILALIALMAGVSLRDNHVLWQQIRYMYERNLMVRRAVGTFEVAVTAMHRDMRGLALTGVDEAGIESFLEQIEVNTADAFRQLDILETRYTGSPEDVAILRETFITWNAIREETVRLLRQGRIEEAAARTKPAGVGGAQARLLRERVDVVARTSLSLADASFQSAVAATKRTFWQFGFLAGLILLVTGLASWLLVRWIRDPLKRLTAVANQFSKGDFATRSGIASTTEFGALAAAFDAMADTIEMEMSINENSAMLAGVMLREVEARSFCQDMLAALIAHTGAQIGAVYLLNEAGSAFEHFESIGLDAGGRAAFAADLREGEFGAALASGRIERITAIPEDTRFTFAAVSGAFRPREIVTIPVRAGDATTAMISLAGVRPFDDKAIRLMNNVWPTITARLNGVLLFRRIRTLAEQLEAQNRELEAQKTELTTQNAEMGEMNAEMEAQNRELEQADRHKSVFLANMSHELRTPLNSVIALTGVLIRRLAGKAPEEEYGYLAIIERNGRHLLTLINDILDLSRIEAGREEVNLDAFAPRDVAAAVTELLEPLAQEKGLALVNQVGDDLPDVRSDADKVRHILQNLAGNAIKFTESGSVTIEARQDDEWLCIAVRDTGIGIPPEALPNIFDAFRQADDSAARKHEGSGLGLTIARRYARLLGGDITVASEPGKGSTFSLRLPLIPTETLAAETAPERADPPPDPFPSPAPDGANRRILLVEDSEAIVIQMTEMLTEQGYRVRTAKNGVEAMARIAEELPDAVILDLMMPEMDGFAVLKTIRGSEQTTTLPVLILTARQVTREELGFLRHNHIHQLIRKGDIRREALLRTVSGLFAPSALALEEKHVVRRRIVSGKPVILIIEDNPDNLRTLEALLRDDCTVVEAGDGPSGLALARSRRPDLILLDLALPEMDGHAVLKAIREDAELRDLPVVAVTASAMKGDRETILDQGFDGYVPKPVDIDELMQAIHSTLSPPSPNPKP